MINIGCIEDIEEDKILTIIYNDYFFDYSLNDLELMESYTGTGGYIKSKLLPETVVIEDVNSYTGVNILTLLDEIPDIPDNYYVTVISSDGWSVNFSKNNCMGYVDVFDNNGFVISNKTTVMIIAYKENGKYYDEIDDVDDISSLRIAFVGNNSITSSNLWSKKVVSIKVNRLE
jgi:hypothetical protein